MIRVPAFPRPGRDGRRVFGRRVLLASLAAATLGMSGCNDNPYCVFTAEGCSDDGGGTGPGDAGGSPITASFPNNGDWILPGSPEVTAFAPEGNGAHPESIIALQFSESLSPLSLSGAFELLDATTGFAETIVDPPPLLANGRIVLLVPMKVLLPAATYSIRLSGVQGVTDLTGDGIVQPFGGEFGSFTVGDPAPSSPQLLLTWPPGGSDDQSDLTQILALFDRPMDSTTFNLSSWQVRVGPSDSVPAVNPFPAPLRIDGMDPLTQVWTWSSQQAQGVVQSLGVDVEVDLRLGEGAPIEDETGAPFGAETITFTLAPIRVPMAAAKHPDSDPADALGGPNLLDTVAVLQVELTEPAQANDTLSLYLTGRASNTSPFAETLTRSISLAAGVTTIDVFPDDLDLLSSPSPIEGRLGDGQLSIAISHERGSVRTAVQLVDADPSDAEAEPLLFDVTAPILDGLGTSGDEVATYSSDLRDLVIVGRANEEIRRVEVMTPMGDNWVDPELPSVVSSDASGLFVAKPVPVGILNSLNGTLDYEVLIFDRALNPADTSALGVFDQLGAVGPGAPLPGPTVKVDVFDVTTLERLSGALVMTHDVDATPVDSEFSDASGHAEPASGAMGLPYVTVQLDGYDIFTIQGLRREVLQVPLRPQGLANAFTEGTVSSASNVDISAESNFIGDSRRLDPGALLFGVDFCALDGTQMEFACPFGPDPVVPARIGGQSLLSADFDVLSVGNFNPVTFLRAFELRLPAPPVDPMATEQVGIEIDALLIDVPEEQATEVAGTLDATAALSANLGTLSGDPLITIEAVSPGTYGNLVMGIGMTFPAGADQWDIRGAYPANATMSGGPVDGDLLLRAELVDTAQNRVGARPRFSPGSTPALVVPDVPELTFPVPGGSSGGTSYVLGIHNVETGTQPGLYRATLTDSTGRRWVLWGEDVGGTTPIRIDVPDLTGFPGGMQLENGTISAQVSLFAWQDLQTSTFMWTDIEREHDLYGHAATVTFDQP